MNDLEGLLCSLFQNTCTMVSAFRQWMAAAHVQPCVS